MATPESEAVTKGRGEGEVTEVLAETRLKLKASYHYSIGRTSELVSTKYKLSISKEFIYALTELAVHQLQLMAGDVEKFCKHAKRSTINSEDIKLYGRRNKDILALINQHIENIQETRATNKKQLGNAKKKGKPSTED